MTNTWQTLSKRQLNKGRELYGTRPGPEDELTQSFSLLQGPSSRTDFVIFHYEPIFYQACSDNCPYSWLFYIHMVEDRLLH